MKTDIMLSNIDTCPSIKDGNQVIRFELDTLSKESEEKAKHELRETPDIVEPSLAKLKELLKEETDMRLPLENKEWLRRFSRPCKYYPESTRDLIKHYFSFKKKHTEIFKDLFPHKEENIFKSDIVVVMPTRDQSGRRILVLELGKRWKHKQVTLDEVFKACVIFLEMAMIEEETQVNGALIIFDMDGLSLQQAWQFTPQFAKRIVDFLQDAVPLRLKGIHVINQPKIFQMVFSLFKPFLREKLKNRIYFHGTDRDSFHKHIEARCLPPCYGGTSNETRITGPQWYELLLKFEKEFEAINSYGYKAK